MQYEHTMTVTFEVTVIVWTDAQNHLFPPRFTPGISMGVTVL